MRWRQAGRRAACVFGGAVWLAAAAPASHGDLPPPRRLMFVGGPTLQRWAQVAPELFRAPDVSLLIALDGRTASVLALLRRSTAAYNAIQILPEPDLGHETAAAAESDLNAMIAAAVKAKAHVVLAAPLAADATPPPAQAVTDWMQHRALAGGMVFGDYRKISFGPAVPVSTAAGLAFRTTQVRGALDQSFHAQPGLDGPSLQHQQQQWSAAQPDISGDGPYPAIRSIDPALPSHTFYRPANLAPFVDHPMPVVIFGNGGCTDDTGSARWLLEEIASHGYLVIAPGYMKSGPGAYPTAAAPGTQPPGSMTPTSARDLTVALDWATGNAPASQGWRRFIDPHHIAVAGWSCGGLQALQTALDPRVGTAMILDSGLFTSDAFSAPGVTMHKADLHRLHVPMLYVLGGLTDIAYGNGSDDVARIDAAPTVLISRDVGHQGTFWQKNGGVYAQAVVSWLAWQSGRDPKAAAEFLGADCGLCRDTGWTVRTRGFPQQGTK